MKTRKEDAARSERRPPTRSMSRLRGPLTIAVAYRRQTPEEQRQFNAALEVFLAEWVRQHVGRVREDHETTIS